MGCSNLRRNDEKRHFVCYEGLPGAKKDDYIKRVERLGIIRSFVARDSTRFDTGYDQFLKSNIELLSTPGNHNQVQSALAFVEEFYRSYHYIGSLEFFRWVSSSNLNEKESHRYYNTYYRSWQEYCLSSYAPIVTINSERISYGPGSVNIGDEHRPKYVRAILYSPIVFFKFLCWQLGEKVARTLVRLPPKQIQSIRNGDGVWKIFKQKYHECIESSSEVFELSEHLKHLEISVNDEALQEVLRNLFMGRIHRIGDFPVLEFVKALGIPISWLLQVFNPVSILTFILGRIFRGATQLPFNRDVTPFYRKAKNLVKNSSVTLAI